MKKEFQLDNHTYFLPQGWQDVTYSQYSQIVTLQGNESLGTMEKLGKMLSVLSGLSNEVIEETGPGLIIPLFDNLAFLSQDPQPEELPEDGTLTIQGQVFKPQPLKLFRELATFDKIDQAPDLPTLEKLPYILAIMLRKEGEGMPQETHEIEKRAKFFSLHLNPCQVLGLAGFFLTNEKKSTALTRLSLQKANIVLGLKENLAAISEKNTGGFPQRMIWRPILQRLTTSLIQKLEKC